MAAGVTIMALALTLTACGTQENTGSTESLKSTETVENTETVKGTETVESTETIENAEIIEAMVSESVAPQGTANVIPQMQPVEYTNLQQITLDSTWEYADHSKINTGAAVLYPEPGGIRTQRYRHRCQCRTRDGGRCEGEDAVPSGRLGEGHRRQYGGGSYGGCCSFRRHDVPGRHTGAGGDITYGTDPAG